MVHLCNIDLTLANYQGRYDLGQLVTGGHGVGDAGSLGDQGTLKHTTFMAGEAIGYDAGINPTYAYMLEFGTVLYQGVAITVVVHVVTVFAQTSLESSTSLTVIYTAASTTWNLVYIRIREGVWRSPKRDQVTNLHAAGRGYGHLSSYDGLDVIEKG